MGEAFDSLVNAIAKLPGMGKKSAERGAIHLAFSGDDARRLAAALKSAIERISPCPLCCGLAEDGALCGICDDATRSDAVLCLVETSADLAAIEKSGAWRGKYHVLGGKLSPIKNVGPSDLSMAELEARLASGNVKEIILALSNDIEGEATCHYISKKLAEPFGIALTRIGFGLPSGSQLGFADVGTIKSAIDSRKNF